MNHTEDDQQRRHQQESYPTSYTESGDDSCDSIKIEDIISQKAKTTCIIYYFTEKAFEDMIRKTNRQNEKQKKNVKKHIY